MRAHRSSAYLASRRFGRRPELFRIATLNAVGWAAVAGLCVAGAATGLAVARLTEVPAGITVPAGAAAAFAAVLVADRRRWAAGHVSYSWTDNLAEVQQMAETLRNAGVDASADTDDYDRPRLNYVNRDHPRVTRAFRAAGLPAPEKS
jgi:hypothetical protein